MMNIRKAIDAAWIKAEILNWYAFEGLLGEVVHNAKCLFAWMDGHLIGTHINKEGVARIAQIVRNGNDWPSLKPGRLLCAPGALSFYLRREYQ